MAENHWRNRIVEQRDADIAELSANPLNWRIHPAAQHQALDAALDAIGWLRPIVVNINSGIIVDGHLRVVRARARGERTIPANFADISEAEEATLLYAFDLSAGLAERDGDKLDALGRRLQNDTTGVVDDPALAYLFERFMRAEAALFEADNDLFRGKNDSGKAGLVRFRVGPYTWDEEEVVYQAWRSGLAEEVGSEDGHVMGQALLRRLSFEHS